jgi:hypothetical protein
LGFGVLFLSVLPEFDGDCQQSDQSGQQRQEDDANQQVILFVERSHRGPFMQVNRLTYVSPSGFTLKRGVGFTFGTDLQNVLLRINGAYTVL